MSTTALNPSFVVSSLRLLVFERAAGPSPAARVACVGNGAGSACRPTRIAPHYQSISSLNATGVSYFFITDKHSIDTMNIKHQKTSLLESVPESVTPTESVKTTKSITTKSVVVISIILSPTPTPIPCPIPLIKEVQVIKFLP